MTSPIPEGRSVESGVAPRWLGCTHQHSTPTVSVIIPCFNYARFLQQCVQSVLSQAEVDVDVIIVDDASTDGSLALATALASRDHRVRVFSNAVNSGPVVTFNRGLVEATGEFVVRLDADDMLTPGSLRRAAEVMMTLPNVGLVYGRPVHFSDTPPRRVRTKTRGWLVWEGLDWLALRCRGGTNVITSPEVVMRRAVLMRVGGQRSLPHTHDMEHWLRIATACDVAYVVGVDQAWHRDHPASLSASLPDIEVMRERLRAFETVLDQADRHGELLSLARQALGSEAIDAAARLLDHGQDDEHVDELLRFGHECAPSLTSSPSWRMVQRRRYRRGCGPEPVSERAKSLFARLGRRYTLARRRSRWRAYGVYERVPIRDVTNRRMSLIKRVIALNTARQRGL